MLVQAELLPDGGGLPLLLGVLALELREQVLLLLGLLLHGLLHLSRWRLAQARFGHLPMGVWGRHAA